MRLYRKNAPREVYENSLRWGFCPGHIFYEEIDKAIKEPAVAQKLSLQGMDLLAGKPAEFDKFLRSEMDRWAKVVRDNKIVLGD